MRWFASLRRTSAFARVRRRGRRTALPTLTAYGVTGGHEPVRIGITVSGAVGGAVVRNRVRRRVQGALAALGAVEGRPPARGELVLILRPESAAAPYSTVAADVAQALERLGPPVAR
jgi:ribonuclease P protein component